MPTQMKILAVLLGLSVAFGSGYWVRNAQENNKKLSSLNSVVVGAMQLQGDLNAALLKLAKNRADAAIKQQKVLSDYANYLKNPDRMRCELDPARVQLKSDAVRAANSIHRP